MSFSRPFSQPAGWPVFKLVFVGLIVVHCIWIVVHMVLVSKEMINPWKLGGYGMYTTASPRPRLQVFDMRFGPTPMDATTYDASGFSERNLRYALRCAKLSEASMIWFFTNNSLLNGVPIQFVIWERKLLRDPIRVEAVPSSLLGIRWTGPDQFRYVGQACGEVYEGQVKLSN